MRPITAMHLWLRCAELIDQLIQRSQGCIEVSGLLCGLKVLERLSCIDSLMALHIA